MSNNIFKQLETAARKDFTDPKWLSRTRTQILAYAKLHPVRKRRFFSTRWFHLVPAMLILAIIMLTGGGVTWAAQTSIPGDFLYSWKINVTESIESAFVVGIRHRADFEVTRTAKRLHEVTELAIRKETRVEVTAQAHVRLEEQIKVASDQIAKVASEDKEKALEVAVELGATLQAHKDVLAQLAPKVDSDTQSGVNDAIVAIEKTTSDVEQKVQDLKQQTKENIGEVDIAARLDAAKKKLENVWAQIAELDDFSKLRVEAEQKLIFAQDALTTADEDLEAKDYGGVASDIQLATKIISETAALLEASGNAGITVKQILDNEPVTTMTPSPAPTKTTVPISSATPTVSTPVPTSTATPKPTTLISLVLDKETYAPYDIINASIRATNTASADVMLSWMNGCQVDAAIGAPPTAQERVCTMAVSSITIPAQQSYIWKLQLVAPQIGGEHVLHAEVIGYGTASIPFTIELHTP